MTAETIAYNDGDVSLQGFLAFDDAVSGRRPGVLFVAQRQAEHTLSEQLA